MLGRCHLSKLAGTLSGRQPSTAAAGGNGRHTAQAGKQAQALHCMNGNYRSMLSGMDASRRSRSCRVPLVIHCVHQGQPSPARQFSVLARRTITETSQTSLIAFRCTTALMTWRVLCSRGGTHCRCFDFADTTGRDRADTKLEEIRVIS